MVMCGCVLQSSVSQSFLLSHELLPILVNVYSYLYHQILFLGQHDGAVVVSVWSLHVWYVPSRSSGILKSAGGSKLPTGLIESVNGSL